MTPWLSLLVACGAPSSSPAPPATPEPVPVTETALSEPARVRLRFGQPAELPGLGGTVTLTAGKRETVMKDDGTFSHHATVGTLRFEHDGETVEVAFTSGQAFEHRDHPMAVYGMDALELVVVPPGQRPRP